LNLLKKELVIIESIGFRHLAIVQLRHSKFFIVE